MNVIGDLLKIEEQEHLWDPEINGIKLWPAIRSQVLYTAFLESNQYTKPHYAPSHISRFSPQTWAGHFRTLRLLLGSGKHHKYQALMFTTARNRYSKLEEGYSFDYLYNSYFKAVGTPLILERSMAAVHKFEKDELFQPFIYQQDTWLAWLQLQARLVRLPASSMRQIDRFVRLVTERFDLNDLYDALKSKAVHTVRESHFIEPLLQSTLLNKLETRLVFTHFCSLMSYSSATTRALHALGYTVLEAQHGIIGPTHYAYNYPSSYLNTPGHPCRDYLPDTLLTYGDYWGGAIRYPVKTVSIGNTYLDAVVDRLEAEIAPADNQVLIVSQGIITQTLVKMTLCLSRAFPGCHIIYKLHPGEINFYDRYKELQHLPNVEIKGIANIYELIAESSIIVGYTSTTLFEALRFTGKRIFILENDWNMPVEMGARFSSPEELVSLISDPTAGYPSTTPTRFWASNPEARISHFIDQYLSG